MSCIRKADDCESSRLQLFRRQALQPEALSGNAVRQLRSSRVSSGQGERAAKVSMCALHAFFISFS